MNTRVSIVLCVCVCVCVFCGPKSNRTFQISIQFRSLFRTFLNFKLQLKKVKLAVTTSCIPVYVDFSRSLDVFLALVKIKRRYRTFQHTDLLH